VARFGTVALRSSLAEDDPLRREIDRELFELAPALNALPPLTRLNPREAAREAPAVWERASRLFGRFAWAIEDLAPVRVDTWEVKRAAVEAFISKGEAEACKVLSRWRVHAQLRGRIVEEIRENWLDFCGSGSNLSTSHFERAVLDEIKARGFFVRTQVPYREFCATERRFRADMVLSVDAAAPLILESREGQLLILEVTSLNDDFIHGPEYRARLGLKRALAEEAGHLFVELTEIDRWRAFIAGLGASREVPPTAFGWLDRARVGEGTRTEAAQLEAPALERGARGGAPARRRFPFWERERLFIPRRGRG